MKRRINIALKTNPCDKKLVIWRGSSRELFELATKKLRNKKLNVVLKLDGEILSEENLCSVLNDETLLFSVDNTKVSDISSFGVHGPEDSLNNDPDTQNIDDDASTVATMMSSAVSMLAIKESDYDGKWASIADELGDKMRELNRPKRCSNLSIATSLVPFQHTTHSWHRSVKREISEHDIKEVIKHGSKIMEGNYIRYTTNKIVLIVTMTNNNPRVITCWRNFLEDEIETDLNVDAMTVSDIDEGTDEYVRQIPVHILRRLIGPDGALIRGIENKTHAKIHVSDIGNFVVISGTSFEIDAAAFYVNDVIDGYGDKAYLDILKLHTARVSCSPGAIRIAIGKKGSNIEYLKEKFGLAYCFFDNSTSVFTLIGSEGSVRVSARQIESISKNGCFLGDRIINISFPELMVGKVIGKKGVTINRIKRMFSAIRTISWEEESKSFKVEGITTDPEYEQQMVWVESLITNIGESGSKSIDDAFFDKIILIHRIVEKLTKQDKAIRELKHAEMKAPQTALEKRIAREKKLEMDEYCYTTTSDALSYGTDLLE